MFDRWNARVSPSSGASSRDPHDVESDLYVTECKATEGKSISVKLDDWLKIRHRAGNGRLPSMAFRFRDPYSGKHIDLFMQELGEQVDQLGQIQNLGKEVQVLSERAVNPNSVVKIDNIECHRCWEADCAGDCGYPVKEL